MPVRPESDTENQRHSRQTTWKRLSVYVVFSLLLILLVGNTFNVRRHLSVQSTNQGWVTHTLQILFELERTESLVKDAETAQRSFLYTGESKYLVPYDLAVAQINTHIDNLGKLTADNPVQQERIPALRYLIKSKLDEIAETITLYQAGRFDDAKAMVMSEAGLIVMNNIRSQIAQMQQEEATQEASRTAALQESTNATIISVYLSTLGKALVLIVLAYLILLEINYRENYLNEIQRREEWYRVTLTSIGDAVICTNPEGYITFVNPVAERLTGWSLPEATGQSLGKVFQIVDATTREKIANPLEKALMSDSAGNSLANCILIRRDGDEIFVEDSTAPIYNREKKLSGSVIVFRDVSTSKALEEQILYASQHDSLTGLPNRPLLMDRLGQAIALAQRNMSQVALLFIDLDDFKHINDSLGHLIGDQLLQSIAKRLQEHVRNPDTVCRQGGDEFVVLLQELQRPKDAAITAKRILQAISDVHTIGQHELYVTASIGVSMYPNDGMNVETLMKNADVAMYQAKDNGRQGFKFFRPAMNVRAVERQSIEEDLRHALEREEFTLHYQPKVDLRTGVTTGAEALLRWTHPTRGSVPPREFIRIAEDTGLILPIGVWVLHQACKQAKCWIEQGLPLTTMSINISAIQFRDENFLDDVSTALIENGLDPGFLELELTESVLMHHPEFAVSMLQNLKKRGIVVSVDDFGTGFSSLSYLKKLQLDTLKIDRSFIHNLKTSSDDAAVAIAIINMGRSLSLRVIAEGVETAEDLAFLKNHDCDEAQGYYLGYPVPADEFAGLLLTS